MKNARRFSMRAGRRGAAMMMVMVVLSLLLILAVSFTFLMSQQEGASVAALGLEQTRITNRTGADHAYARLSQASRLSQYQRWYESTPPDVSDYDNPYLDLRDEHFVSLKQDFEGSSALFSGAVGPDGRRLYPVSDPRRMVQGLTVADETGKVNINFSSVYTLANLLGSALVTTEVRPAGGVYPEVPLTDAGFLDAYDRGSGGYVVIGHQLFSYASREGNMLYEVTPNPAYNGLPGGNAIFAWRTPARELVEHEFVCTPTAYKVMLYRLLNARGDVPAIFNHVADIRRIAELPRLFSPDPRFGPEIMGQRLDGWPEGIGPVTYQMLLESATAISPAPRFDGGWFNPQVVTFGGMIAEGESGLNTMLVRFTPNFYVPNDPREGLSQFGGDNLVRLRNARGDTILGWARGGGAGSMRLVVVGAHELDVSEGWILEFAERAEVNINTANFESLVAFFHGAGGIDRASARVLAGRVLAYLLGDELDDQGRVPSFRTMNELWTFLRELSQEDNPPITAEQIGALAAGQSNPYRGGALPLRTDSLGAYMVESLATSYMPAGGTRARSGFREWALVGNDNEETLYWEHYLQFLDEMRAPQGNIMQLHMAGVQNRRLTGLFELPFLYYGTERGPTPRQRLAPPWSSAQTHNMAAMAANNNERFYANIEEIASPSGGTYEGGDLESGMFSFWYRRQWEDMDANHYLFDAAEQEYSNRMSLLWWGDRRGAHNLRAPNRALTLRVKDRTLEEAYTELRYELDGDSFRQDEWYHLTANWKGTDLSHLSLLIDGDSTSRGITPQVSHSARQVNGAWVNRTSTLQTPLEDPKQIQATQTEIVIDPQDIDAFPDQGVVVIGDEAIEYNGKMGTALINIYRGPPNPNVQGSATGARGTVATAHPRGAKVTVFGYTSQLRPVLQQAAPTQTWRPRFPQLPATRGMLRSHLGNRAFYRVQKPGSDNAEYYRPVELGPDSGFPGAASPGGNPNVLPLADYEGLPERGVVMVIGVAWQGYFEDGTAGIPPPGGMYPRFEDDNDPATTPDPPARRLSLPLELFRLQCEYVAYDGRSAEGLNVVARYDGDFNYKPQSQWYHFLGTFPGTEADEPLIMPSTAQGSEFHEAEVNAINFLSRGSVVMLMSIDVDSVQGYHDRSIVQINDEWMFYNVVWNPELAQDIGGGTADGRDDNLFPSLILVAPWRAPDMDDEGNLVSVQGWWSYIFSNALQGNMSPVPRAPWRGACQTNVSVHGAAARVLPVFGTTVKTGRMDTVTLVRGKNSFKQERTIRQQRDLGHPANQIEWRALFGTNFGWPVQEGTWLCAFFEHVPMDYPANIMPETNPNWRFNPAGTNLCKFPTGELPVELPTAWTFAGADPRTLDAGGSDGSGADFDSFELRRFTMGDFALISDMTVGTPGEGGEILVTRASTALPFGVIKLDDELICYRRFENRNVTVWDPATQAPVTLQVAALMDISRGILGTRPQAHSGGTPVLVNGNITGGKPYMNMASLRIGRPVAADGPRQHEIRAILGDGSFRPYGFVRIEDQGSTEVVGYQRYEASVQVLEETNQQARIGTLRAGIYRAADWSQALFRGAYGTTARTYSDRALIFDQPVRFPDWFPGFHSDGEALYGAGPGTAESAIPGAVSPEITHVQGAMTLRNSVFTRFRWRIQYLPNAIPERHAGAINARLVLRFKEAGKPLPEWDSVPTNQPGGLFAFDFDLNGRDTRSFDDTLYEQTEDFTRIRGLQQGIRADRVEWRVYMYFQRNAYANENYKTTLQFQGGSMDVRQITRVVRHEERR